MTLKEAREAAGLSQGQLSQLSGVHVSTISKIERGVAKIENVTLANAAALAKAMNIKIEELL